MENCIFCKIAKKEIPSDILLENEQIVAFRDIHPQVPVHVLIIPKKHIGSVTEIEPADAPLMGEMIVAAKKIADNLRISEKGYKLLFRVGEYGGQEVKHIHLHLIGGAKLTENIGPIE